MNKLMVCALFACGCLAWIGAPANAQAGQSVSAANDTGTAGLASLAGLLPEPAALIVLLLGGLGLLSRRRR